MPEFHFGSGSQYAVRTDVANSTPMRFGALQDISIEISGDIKELYGQNAFALSLARGKMKIEGKAKFAQISARVFNDLFFGQTVTAGQILSVDAELDTVPAAVVINSSADTASGATIHFTSTTGVVVGAPVSGPANIPAGAYVLSFVPNTSVTLSAPVTGDVPSGSAITFGPSVTVANAATFVSDAGVRYASTGTALVLVASGPTVGQYAVNAAGGYIFNAADVAAQMVFSYQFSATTGKTITISNQLMGALPTFQAVFTTTFRGKTLTLVLFCCVAPKLSLPTKLDDYQIAELDFQAQDNGSGLIGTLSLSDA